MKTVRFDDGLSGFRQMGFVIDYNVNYARKEVHL